MPPRVAVVLLSLLALLLLASPAAAGPDEKGWERFETVPTWVTDPPVREGVLRAVDVGLSNLLDLAYDPDRVPRDRLNLRWQIERRLRRLLGAGAREPALAGARAATVVRKGFHHQRAVDPEVVGGQVHFAFVLWETPLDGVLAAVPEAQRAAAVVALRAQPLRPAWTEVDGEPAWAGAHPTQESGSFVVVATERARRADVARAVADLRGRGHVGSQIQGRLRFHVGNDLASRIAERAASYATVLARAWCGAPGRAWIQYQLPRERILEPVPAAFRERVSEALGQPVPPRPWTWQAVDAEPDWVGRPPRWPDHRPYVQTVESALADVAREQSIRGAEGEIREHLEALLRPVVGPAAAGPAARAGAARRVQGAHAIREREAGPADARASRAFPVTAWTLWEIPIAAVLEALDPRHHAAARAALLP